MPDKVKILYDAVSKDYNVGSFEEFQSKLQDDTKRKAFYDGVGAEFDLGDFKTFSSKVKKKDDSQPDFQTGSQTLLPGSKPFQTQVPTEAPSVLTPKGKTEYQEQVKKEKDVLTSQLESAKRAFATVQGEDVVRDIELYQQDPESFRFKEDNTWLGNSIKQGLLQGELANTLPTGGRVPTPEDLSLAADINYQIARIPQSDAQKEYEKSGFGVFKNPLLGAQFLTETIASSLSALYESSKRTVPTATATGAGAGALFGGIGALPGAGLGLSAGLSVAGLNLSTSGDIMQSLRDSGVDITDKDALIKAFSDENKMSEIRTKALKYGVPILAFDMATAGIAGKLIGGASGKSVAKKIVAGLGEAGIQSLGGSAGELAGQIASGKKIDWNEVALEGIASLATDAPDVAIGVLTRDKASSSNKNIATQINKLGVEDGVSDAKINLDRDLANNVITPQEYEEGIKFIERAVVANDKIPVEVQGDNREQSIELIAKKDDILAEVQGLNEQKEKTDDSYHPIIDEQIKLKEKEVGEINSQIQKLAQPVEQITEVETIKPQEDALKDVESTAKALEGKKKSLDEKAKKLGYVGIKQFNAQNQLNENLSNEERALLQEYSDFQQEVKNLKDEKVIAKLSDEEFSAWSKANDITRDDLGKVVKDDEIGLAAKRIRILNERGDTKKADAELKKLKESKKKDNWTVESWKERFDEDIEQSEIDDINDSNREFNQALDKAVEELLTPKKQEDAVQIEAAGQVPVQPEATISEEVEQRKSEAKPEVVAKESQVQEEITPEQYVQDLQETKQSNPEEYWSVDDVSIEAAKDGTVIKEDGGYGLVSKSGDIKGVFKSAKSKAKNVADKILQKAVKAGGIKLDNFDTYLTKIYERNGFKVVSRIPFNEEFAPVGWNKEKHGTPDVVAMVYDPDNKLNVKEKSFTDYDKAIAYRDKYANKVKSTYPLKKEEPKTVEFELAEMEKLFGGTFAPSTENKGISVTNKSAVGDVKSKSKDATKVKVIESAQKLLKTLRSVLPEFDIVIHDNEGSYNAAMSEVNGVANSSGNFSYIRNNNGSYSGRIDINLNVANSRTVAHEVAHGIMLKAFGDNPALFKNFRDRISKVISEGANQYLTDFASQYQGEVAYEEYLVELSAVLVDQKAKISPTSLQKIALIINDVVSRITKGSFKPFEDVKNTKDVIDFFNNISESISKGEEINIEDKSGEVGSFNIKSKSQVKAPKASEDSRDFIRDLVKDIDIREFNGKSFVTNMYDYTTAGVADLGNGFKINMLGGKNYVPYMMSLQNKKIGDISNLAAFNTKSQAEAFIRNAKNGNANLFAPHSGTMSASWQFQQHTFAELVDLILDQGIMKNEDLIKTFNKTIQSSEANKKAFKIFEDRYKKNIENFDSFESDPKKIVELLDIQNNYSPDLRKVLNNAIAADKTFQKAIGIKNKEEFFDRIKDPLNKNIIGGEIMSVVDFDPNTFEIIKTKPDAIDHHPSFAWTLLAKINGIYQPTSFYKSSEVTDVYIKYNSKNEVISRKELEPKFEQKNVSSSAGAIPKVAEFKEQPISKAQLTSPDAVDKLISDARSKGFSDSAIEQFLKSKGISDDQINKQLSKSVDDIKQDLKEAKGKSAKTEALSALKERLTPDRFESFIDENPSYKRYDAKASQLEFNADTINDLVELGATYIEGGVNTFSDFAERLNKEYGKEIPESVLRDIYKRSAQKTGLGVRRTPERIATGEAISPKLKEIADETDSLYQKQEYNEIQDILDGMSEADKNTLVGTLANVTGQLNEEGNIGVLAAIDLINTYEANGDKAGAKRVFDTISRSATAFAQLLRQYGQLKSSTPQGYVSIIEKAMKNEYNIELTDDQKNRIEELYINSKNALDAEVAALNELADNLKDPNYDKSEGYKKWGASTVFLEDANRKLSDYIDSLKPATVQSLFQNLTSMVQGNLLSPKSLLVNPVANAAQAGTRIAGNEIANLFDFIINVTLKTGRTKISGFDPQAISLGSKAFARGLDKANRMLIKGAADTDLAKIDVASRLKPVNAWKSLYKSLRGKQAFDFVRTIDDLAVGTLGVPSNLLLRLLPYGDLPRNEQVKIAKLIEIGRNKFNLKGADLEAFTLRPDPASLAEAQLEGDKSTLQQPNVVYTFISKIINSIDRKAEDKFTQFLLSLIRFMVKGTTVPFLKTPINYAAKAVRFTNPIIPYSQALYHMTKAILAAKNVKNPLLREASIRRHQSKLTEYLGEAVIAQAIMSAALILIGNGLVTGDAPEEKENKKERDLMFQSLGPNMINISGLKRLLSGEDPTYKPGDKAIAYNALGVLGAQLGISSNTLTDKQKEEIRKNKFMTTEGKPFYEKGKGFYLTSIQDMSSNFPASLNFTLNQGFAQGAGTLLSSIQENKYSEWSNQTIKTLVTGLAVPNTVYQSLKAGNDYYRNVYTEDQVKTWGNIISERLGKIDDLPIRYDMWGKPIKLTPKGSDPYVYHVLDIFRTQKILQDKNTYYVFDLFKKTGDKSVIPSSVKDIIDQEGGVYIKLTPAQKAEFERIVGEERAKYVSGAKSSPFSMKNYDPTNDNEDYWKDHVDKLKLAYELGLEYGKVRFEKEILKNKK